MASLANESGSRRGPSDHESFLVHKRFRWLKIAIALCVILSIGYAFADVDPRPNGGTWYGYTLGTIGVALIVWLSLLGIRKRAMTEGRWSLKAWTSAHVYLGLSLIVIATLHTGFQLGWNVHTLAYALMMLVILSGLYGVVVYATLPEKLSTNRGDMSKKQMVEALGAIDRQLEAAAQPLARDESDLVIAALEQDAFKAGVIARLTNSYPRCRTERALAAFAADRSRDEHEDRVFGLLQRRSAQLGQIRRQMRLRALLDIWLYVHIPATVALLGALTAHVISVFYYW
ncbi:Ferric reductase like transmembrane component [Tsuneonella dongtanensis]|uniref:Ferric reductase like transmembrane component n=1 Tax=Tsuneonella dongtanensis TaxID=692370 RepID=A0A1B2A8U8_9SPHN|nr:hypothetical protein [Tsuneonella dongtanensis]ANY18590.1 Ferric reductase like transmembrane component [Tsuneonella dongtanensis]